MFRNCLLLALVLAVVGASTTTNTASVKKPTAKSTLEIRKSQQKSFHTAPRAKMAEKLAARRAEDEKKTEKKARTTASAAAVAPSASASLRGAAISVMEVTQPPKITNKAKLFSPNRGFLEFIDYTGSADCSQPAFIYGSAVNFCYYDAETNGAYADVATITKMPANAPWYYSPEYLTTTTLVFSDPFCTVTNATATLKGYSGPDYRGLSYCSSFYSNVGTDHVFEPTPVHIPDTVMFREYETEAGCVNDDIKELISYGSMVGAYDYNCQEYINENEFVKVLCVDGVPKAEIYPSWVCAAEDLIRVDDLSNTCGDQNSAYPRSFKCPPPPQP